MKRFPALSALALAGLSLVGSTLVASPARAEPSADDLAHARTVFNEGLALAYANNCAAALPKYREVASIKMTPQVAFAIAECEERTGKLVSALGNYRLAQSSAAGDPKAEKAVESAPDRITALEARIPKLTVKRGKNADDVAVVIDATEVGASLVGTPVDVDPGPHTVIAKRRGEEVAKQTVSVAEKETKTFTLDVPADSVVAPQNGGDPSADQGGRSKVPGYVLVAGGGASVIVSAIFIGLRAGTISDLNAACGGTSSCPKSSSSIADKGKTYTGVAEITMLAGVGGLAAGIIWIATAGPSKPPAEPTARVGGARVALRTSSPGADRAGLSLAGSF